MLTTPPDPKVADAAPGNGALISCGERHIVTFRSLLKGAKKDASWHELVKLVLRGCDGQAV